MIFTMVVQSCVDAPITIEIATQKIQKQLIIHYREYATMRLIKVNSITAQVQDDIF